MGHAQGGGLHGLLADALPLPSRVVLPSLACWLPAVGSIGVCGPSTCYGVTGPVWPGPKTREVGMSIEGAACAGSAGHHPGCTAPALPLLPQVRMPAKQAWLMAKNVYRAAGSPSPSPALTHPPTTHTNLATAAVAPLAYSPACTTRLPRCTHRLRATRTPTSARAEQSCCVL